MADTPTWIKLVLGTRIIINEDNTAY